MSDKKRQLHFKMKETELAIVLLDIIGSTKIVERIGAKHAAILFQVHDRLARNLYYRFNGREIDRSDGFLLSFESIVDAVNFALHYQHQIPMKTKLSTRIGVHWGKIIEVHQDDLWVGVGAKRVELEGLSKNIAARTMSLCAAGQVLLTEQAYKKCRGRMNSYTPKLTRYVCVGVYRFKGVSSPQRVYAVGTSLKSLQPPKSNDKVKKLAGPKKVKGYLRQMQTQELMDYFIWRLGMLSILVCIVSFYLLVSKPLMRDLLGLQWWEWVDVVNLHILNLIDSLMNRNR